MAMLRIICFPVLFSLISCRQSHNNASRLDLDSTKIVIFSLDTTTIDLERNVELSFLKEEISISLTQDDLTLIETKLEECITEINNDQKITFERYNRIFPSEKLSISDFLVTLSKYRRQYVPYQKRDGDRYVWVNCFPAKSRDSEEFWRSIIISSLGGGTCCFSVTINLSKKKHEKPFVNAPI
jgi:hypothetical protein